MFRGLRTGVVASCGIGAVAAAEVPVSRIDHRRAGAVTAGLVL
jgi:hypothetical protein